MTDKEKQDFIVALLLESSKAILSTVDIERQYKRKPEGGVYIDSYVAHVASVIVSDFVVRTLKQLESKKLI